MVNNLTESQVRMKLALLIHNENIDIEMLYGALGVDLQTSNIEAVSHFAGVIDGLALAKGQEDSKKSITKTK